MFHNYQNLIARHSRSFQLYKKESGSRDSDTSRYRKGFYADPITLNGVMRTVTDKDMVKYPDFELHTGDMKLTISGSQLGNITIDLKDRVEFEDGRYFFVHRVVNNLYYGNHYIIFLKAEKIGV